MNSVLVIVGAAPEAKADLDAIGDKTRFDFMAIGLDAADKWLGRYEYVVTHEPRDLGEFRQRREHLKGNLNFKTYSQEPFLHQVDVVLPELTAPSAIDLVPPANYSNELRTIQYYSGSSALLGVKVGFRLGYRKMILCGVPLLDEKYIGYRRGWLFVMDLIKDNVRSMSGWTKQIFGEPDEEWLNG